MKLYFWTDFEKSDAIKRHGNFTAEFLKVATLCRLSWEQQGWEIIPVSCRNADGFKWFGRLNNEQGAPLWMYNIFHVLHNIVLQQGAGIWFSEADVFNQGFTPASASAMVDSQTRWMSLKKGFGFGAFYAAEVGLRNLIQIANDYDAGEGPLLNTEHSEIEPLARRSLIYEEADLIQYPFCGRYWQSAPLLHLTRSAIQFFE
jgi:hypothetical protein